MRRLYVGRVETLAFEGAKPGARGPAWYNILGASAPVVRQIVDSVDPAQFAIGVLDTDANQHSALTGAANRIIYVNASVFSTPYNDLPQAGKNQVIALEQFLGINLIEHTVELIVWAMVGHAVAKGVDELTDLL